MLVESFHMLLPAVFSVHFWLGGFSRKIMSHSAIKVSNKLLKMQIFQIKLHFRAGYYLPSFISPFGSFRTSYDHEDVGVCKFTMRFTKISKIENTIF